MPDSSPPVGPDGQAIVARYWGRGTSGTYVAPGATDAGGGARAGGMLGHFPEPVVPNPNVPGQWVGTLTGTVYDAGGHPLGGGSQALTPGGPPPVYPWGLDPAGGPGAPRNPLSGLGGAGGPLPFGPPQEITVRLVLDGSAEDIVRIVTADAEQVVRLADASFGALGVRLIGPG